jgi:hypothetical protein
MNSIDSRRRMFATRLTFLSWCWIVTSPACMPTSRGVCHFYSAFLLLTSLSGQLGRNSTGSTTQRRRHCWPGGGKTHVTAGEYYRGALVHPSISSLEFQLPGIVETVTCKEQFPNTRVPPRDSNKSPIAWDTGLYGVLNCNGAPFDEFTGNPGNPASKGPVLRTQQHKWARSLAVGPVSRASIQDEVAKVCEKEEEGEERMGRGRQRKERGKRTEENEEKD